jgi:hypothetical protein
MTSFVGHATNGAVFPAPSLRSLATSFAGQVTNGAVFPAPSLRSLA